VLGFVWEGGEVGRLQFRLDRRLECRDPLGLGVLVLLMLFRCAPSGSSLSPSSSESRYDGCGAGWARPCAAASAARSASGRKGTSCAARAGSESVLALLAMNSSAGGCG
jgi:hypothetical protein